MAKIFSRRQFIRETSLLAGGMSAAALLHSCQPGGRVMTVRGAIDAGALGNTLVHEHVLVDFIGADQIVPGRYNRAEVVEKVLPYLKSLKLAGCDSLIECTPAFLGRDPLLLRQLSEASGLHIVTNTGYYGAAEERFLPASLKTASAKDIAGIWISEFHNGIEGTNIRPGFMKLAVDDVPFSPSILKILEAATLTFRETGLPIAIHTSKGGRPALEELRLLRNGGVPADAWIWVHAQNESDIKWYAEAAAAGAWVELDGISESGIGKYVRVLQEIKQAGFLNRLLISQDAGWYHVGEAGGGDFRPYDTLFRQFLPALRQAGFSDAEINQLIRISPALAFRLRQVN